MEMISFAAHEADMERVCKIVKSLIVIIALLIAVIIAGCFGFLHYTAQFETVEETTTQYEAATDGGGTAIAGAEGGVTVNGESKSDQNESQIPQA